MVLQPQTARNWRLLTIVTTTYLGFHTVFLTEYQSTNGKPHVFHSLQHWYNDNLDKFLGIKRTLKGKPVNNSSGVGAEEVNMKGKYLEKLRQRDNVAAPTPGLAKGTKAGLNYEEERLAMSGK